MIILRRIIIIFVITLIVISTSSCKKESEPEEINEIIDNDTPVVFANGIIVFTGGYPNEISWYITNELGEDVIKSPIYYNQNNLIKTEFHFSPGDYSLGLLDSNNDGWNGAYISILKDSVIIVNKAFVTTNDFLLVEFSILD